MRLIDADALDRAFTDLRFNSDGTLNHWGDRPGWCMHGYEVEKLIADAPTVDAVPVVRCKDCKHCFVDGDNVRFNVCELNHNRVQADDWFCADGERKGGGRVMERTCENCKYSCVDSAIAAMFCMGQKNMPRVRPFDTCKDWKSMRITNAEKYFRNATDEEIAKWIHRHDCHTNLYGYDNEEAILDWLKQEVESDA